MNLLLGKENPHEVASRKNLIWRFLVAACRSTLHQPPLPHNQSHGESFLSLLQHRFTRSGFYVMDEPEAALSPQRQLSFLVLLHDLLDKNDGNIQFLIATHSPILLAYPGAQILSFDGGQIHEISYRESQPFRLVS